MPQKIPFYATGLHGQTPNVQVLLHGSQESIAFSSILIFSNKGKQGTAVESQIFTFRANISLYVRKIIKYYFKK